MDTFYDPLSVCINGIGLYGDSYIHFSAKPYWAKFQPRDSWSAVFYTVKTPLH